MRSLLVVLVCALALSACGSDDPAPPAASSSRAVAAVSGGSNLLRGSFARVEGSQTDLSKYAGKVVLVVNTASHCGFTPQFDGLQKLYESRRARGLVILGFPSNDFNQELGANAQIAEFCKANYGVTFPMFAKSHVTGGSANALFKSFGQQPGWNFTKYLLDRHGRLVKRFDTAVEPSDPAVTGAIDSLL